ncbi:DNA-binding transcriptional activator GcvA [Actibacterium pelagium]|uniref:DNA-binding transcriptional activator GcvA n=2 Tax=Actibacterium pelagium TaxID=2029103 RepID=A0A917AGS3_9RHOB|nr:DNA-binding transcriptional activator GcvA [Actibacterium pelagium]
MSFAKAADELNVTPAALSFQIKSLEEYLGQPLFIRLNRAVKLTEAGRVLSPGVTEGFQTLTAAWRAARRLQNETTLSVTAGPAFTAKWLAPRLYEFARANPEVDLRFTASLRVMDFELDEVDVAIRFGLHEQEDPSLWSQPFAREWVTPVMSPEMAKDFPTPESLRDAPILFDDSLDFLANPVGWSAWLEKAGVDFTPTHGPHFSNSDHAVDAAIAGAGVVLGRRSITVKDLHEGKLVAPYGLAIETRAHYRFVCRKGTETRPHIAAFLDWMLSEVEKTASVHEQLTIVPVG